MTTSARISPRDLPIPVIDLEVARGPTTRPGARRGNRRRVAEACAVSAVLIGSLVAALPVSSASAQIFSGGGWKIENNDYQIRSLDIHTPYVFTFTSAANRSLFTPYLTAVASQLAQATGLRFTVSTIIEPAPTSCGNAPKHHIVFDRQYRPTGQAGISQANPCTTLDGSNSAWGGWVTMDSEYWTGWNLTTAMLKNSFAHESGHMVGLDHPNSPAGTAYACPKTSDGYLPVMCSPNGGYTDSRAGQYVRQADVPGLKQLVRNGGGTPPA
jgi:hypothetical protein